MATGIDPLPTAALVGPHLQARTAAHEIPERGRPRRPCVLTGPFQFHAPFHDSRCSSKRTFVQFQVTVKNFFPTHFFMLRPFIASTTMRAVFSNISFSSFSLIVSVLFMSSSPALS